MTPTVIHLRANTAVPKLSNTGAHFLSVLHGAIDVHTRYYTPAHLNTGDSIYFDSEMLLRRILPSHTLEIQRLSIHANLPR